MNNRATDVIVIGAGLMGASAAWHLTQRGLATTVLEQYELDHVRGSSHGAARIFRVVYKENDYIELARRALTLWRDLEQKLGRELLRAACFVDVGPANEIAPFAAALDDAGISYERLSGREAKARVATYLIPDEWEALFQAESGVLHADACRLGMLDLACRAGAVIETETAVTRLIPDGSGVLVETTRGGWKADVAVVTAASWSNRLLAPLDLAIPLRVTREQVIYYSCHQASAVFPLLWHVPGDWEMYALPNGDRPELKVGQHKSGLVVNPDSPPEVDDDRLEPVREFVREVMPDVATEELRSESCLYASTPDDDFVLDRIGPIVLGTGFGGHGFKFGSVVGELLADLVAGKKIEAQERFAHARFRPAD
jgi:sarcosine oxidase